jgi:hypothetical protein
MAECYKQEGRLQGLINHYQRKELEKKREEEKKLERNAEEAKKLREEAQHATGKAKKELEAKAFDLEMELELALVPVIDKPKGLVVKDKINFQVIDAIVFCQAYPQFWKWNEENEFLKLDRMLILDELNKENGKGVFHKTTFPEELSETDDPRLVRPAGLRVYPEVKSHLR